MSAGSGEGVVSAFPTGQDERQGLRRLNTHNQGQKTGFISIPHSPNGPLLWFPFHFPLLVL